MYIGIKPICLGGICIAEVSPHRTPPPAPTTCSEPTSAMGVTQPLTALCTQFKQQLSHLCFGLAYISSNGFFSLKNWNRNMQPACQTLSHSFRQKDQTSSQCGMTSYIWSALFSASPFPLFPSSLLVLYAAATLQLHCPVPAWSGLCSFSPLGLDCVSLLEAVYPPLPPLALSLQSFLGLSFLKKGWGNSWKYSPNNQYIP